MTSLTYVLNVFMQWRAPEEYLMQRETEKIDVFSLGNVLYFLLTKKEPFDDISPADAIKLIEKGQRLEVTDKNILKSKHPFDSTVLKALDMCFVYEPKKRASARQVANLFDQALKKVESQSKRRNGLLM